MVSLSIIIPSYNRAALVDKTLLSMTRQTTSDFEIILMDHGSTDNTEEVYEKYKERLPLSYYKIGREDERFTAAVPRAVGVHYAQGEFFAFIDTGMVVPQSYAQAHITFHHQHKNYVGIGLQHGLDWQFKNAENGDGSLDLQFGNAEEDFTEFLRHADVGLADMVLKHPELLDRRVDIDLSRSHTPWFYGWTANISMPREAYFAAGGFDIELKGWGFEDVDLCYRLAMLGLKFAFVEDGWGIELPQPRQPMKERLQAHLRNMIQAYGKYRNIGLEALILRQMLLHKAVKAYYSQPQQNVSSTIHDVMREKFTQQAEDFYEYLISLGQEAATLPALPGQLQSLVAHPALLIGGTDKDAGQYEYIALASEDIHSTSSRWSCSGVLIPLADQSLETVVVSDIWKKLGWSILYPFGIRSMSLLEVLISEISRTAKKAIFVHTSSVTGASVETLENLCRSYTLSYTIVEASEPQESNKTIAVSGENS